jgi:hypothetical protein
MTLLLGRKIPEGFDLMDELGGLGWAWAWAWLDWTVGLRSGPTDITGSSVNP